MLKINRTEKVQVFYTSDLHLSHKGLCKGTSSWEDKSDCRDFDSLESMNSTIIDGINKVVREDDYLFILGDFYLGPNSQFFKFRTAIKCKNVHLIFGNHDDYLRDPKSKSHEWFSSVQMAKEIKVDGLIISLYHYKPYIWRDSQFGTIALYGHSHGDAEYIEHGKSMDVGIDNAFRLFKEWRPFSHDEVLELLKDRSIETIDHHKPHIDKLLGKKDG